jgi:UDP-N-acetylmuramoyl-tripeptide--D-alanyl-D-alanine ligase
LRMPRLNLEHISEVIAGEIRGGKEAPASVFATGYAFDSRVLEAGDLFFAIRGDRRDGHLFVGDAAARGAAGAVVERTVEGVPSAFPQIVVESTLAALQALASDVRRQVAIPVVAITGSNGKTTTKEMVTAILASRMKVRKSPGNFNNHIGVPISILGLEEDHGVLVVELGSNHRGEIAALAKIVRPTIGVVLNAGPAHIGHFGSVEEIAREKTDLLRSLAPGGKGVVNGDDATLMRALGDVEVPLTLFGTCEGADYRATAIGARGAGATAFEVGGVRVTLKAAGLHNVYNALAAIAASALVGVPPVDAAGILAGFRSFRMKTFTFAGITVIDDTYNANPDSILAALAFLAGFPAERRVFVMGEMLELGDASARLHRETGRAVAESGVDVLIGIGGDTEKAVAGAIASGMPVEAARFFAAKAEAAAFLTRMLKAGDVVLVKGSRGAALEDICDYLRQESVEERP